MTVPGTIARNQKPNLRREVDAPEADSAPKTEAPARQTATAPWSENDPQSRREYFRSLIPGFGALLVRGLRTAEEIQRKISDPEKLK